MTFESWDGCFVWQQCPDISPAVYGSLFYSFSLFSPLFSFVMPGIFNTEMNASDSVTTRLLYAHWCVKVTCPRHSYWCVHTVDVWTKLTFWPCLLSRLVPNFLKSCLVKHRHIPCSQHLCSGQLVSGVCTRSLSASNTWLNMAMCDLAEICLLAFCKLTGSVM